MVDDLGDLALDLGLDFTKPNLRAGLIPQQIAFLDDPATRKAARTSRQAGKTEDVLVMLTEACLERPCVCAYINRQTKQAKATVWQRFKDFFRKHEIPVRSAIGDSCLHFANGSILYVLGAKDKLNAEFFRGQIYRIIVLDETQSFEVETLRFLLDKVLDACLFKEGGTLAIVGTPDTICNGFFHDVAPNEPTAASWPTHHWTWRDNPGLPNKDKFHAELLRSHQWTGREPEYISEWEGKWCKDIRTLLFEGYRPIECEYKTLPPDVRWSYTLGCDVGATRDLSAFVLWAWSMQHKVAHVVREDVASGRDVTAFCQKVQQYWAQIPGLSVIMDDGALGAGYLKELQQRWKIPALGKTKTKGFKAGMVRIINDQFRKGTIQVCDSTTPRLRFQLENVRFDQKTQIENELDPMDFGDAFLYGYSHVYSFLYEPEAPELPSQRLTREAEERYQRTARQFRTEEEVELDEVMETPEWPE